MVKASSSKKVCLVTGARSGIGKSIAELFSRSGYRVIMSAKKKSDCSETVAKLKKTGLEVVSLDLDLSKPSALDEKINEANAVWGRIDLLINNAAVVEPIAKLGDLNLEETECSAQINFVSPLILINSCWDYLKYSEGKILNILSGAATNPIHGWAAYCSTKAALKMVNHQAHIEGTEFNIKSIGISPGMVDTSMQEKIRKSGINPISKVKQSDLLSKEIPAKLCLWCASSQANDLSGTMVSLNDPNINRRFVKWDREIKSSK